MSSARQIFTGNSLKMSYVTVTRLCVLYLSISNMFLKTNTTIVSDVAAVDTVWCLFGNFRISSLRDRFFRIP